MSGGACPPFLDLAALAEGGAADASRDETRAHARACTTCARALEGIEADLVLEGRVRAHFAQRPSPAVESSIEGFRIVRELGRGGMGVVFEAEQLSPARTVALKVVRGSAWVDASTLRLFQREIRVLARLAHEGIASLHDAGSTATGEHWFAMELVRGGPLVRHAQELPRRARLELFRQLAGAIDYAHQRGVVHRDLKPSNVLVDARGRVKVLDFGLAKITDQDVAATSQLSEPGAIRGTLAYMSPEQARGDPTAIDLRSDVYSLGAILFELLTARVPSDVFGVHIHEAARRICEEAPPRPSVLDASLRGDLETIVLKALEKEPARRYASAAALSEDVRRFLEDEPILARPASGLYHARKLVARHRLATGLVLSIFVLAIGTAAWTSVLYARETGLREAADTAAEEARVRALTAEKTKDFLVGVFETNDLERENQADPPASKLLAKGVADVAGKLADEPAVRAELLETFGKVYTSLGRYAEARPLLEEALALRRAQGPPARAALADALDGLGAVLVDQRAAAAAVPLHEEALRLRRELEGEGTAGESSTMMRLAEAVKDAGDLPRAEAMFRDVLARERARGAGEEGKALAAENHLAMVLVQKREFVQARALMEHALALVRVQNPRTLRLSAALNDLGLAVLGSGDAERAEALLRESIDLRVELLGEENAAVGKSSINLASALTELGRTQDAIDTYERARAILAKTLGDESPLLATALHGLASLRSSSGENEEAEALCRQAIAIRVAANDPDHPDVAEGHDLLGRILIRSKRAEEAAASFAEAADAFERRLGPGSLRVVMTRTNLGVCQLALQRYDEAQTTLEANFEVLCENPEATAKDKRFGALWLAKVHKAAGRPDEAARYDEIAKGFTDPPPTTAP